MSEPRIAIVTGASSGIGMAVARQLQAEGATVVGLDLVSVGDGWRTLLVDVTDAHAVDEAVGRIVAEHGTIDLLVNNAGGGPPGRIAGLSDAQWHQTLALNLDSAFFLMRAVVAHMPRRGGAIVNISSLAAHRVSPRGGPAYAAAKAGLIALTRQAAHEFAPRGIRVNAILPGPTRTALTEGSIRTDADFPLGRWVAPEDIAAAVCFLLGAQAAMITGSELTVDGGMMLG